MEKAKEEMMKYDIGMIGLGVMGQNLILNLIDHGFHVSGFDINPSKVQALQHQTSPDAFFGASTLQQLADSLNSPRIIMILVPAGAPVDSALKALTPLLKTGDIIVDAGNSYYKDTDIRGEKLKKNNLIYFGIGISGGEEGARSGLSIMPGGPIESYEHIRPMLEAIAAKIGTESCVAYLGPGSAGHFVKMVHNGIEYGIMQLLAESYDLMKRGLQMSDDEIHDIFVSWNSSDLSGYLVEITGKIFSVLDDKSGQRLINVILDVAKQNGTGMWTSQSAIELHVPTPTITLAVGMRNMSVIEDQRKKASLLFPKAQLTYQGDKSSFLNNLRSAFYAGMIITYAEGMSVLKTASEKLHYQFTLDTIAKIWRKGCIIQTAFLQEIMRVYAAAPSTPNILLDKEIAERILQNEKGLRSIVKAAADLGIPAPGFMTALSYFDGYRSPWLPANLIQAQRDYFGAHAYERIDAKGTFHTLWEHEK